ncbi:phosphopantetheine-binding protein [Bacillus sp. SL00103]
MERHFRIEKVERDDHFFELGGHSLNATGLISQIYKEFGVELTLTDMFNNPTIEKLQAFIEKAEKHQYFKIEPVERKTRIHYLLLKDGHSSFISVLVKCDLLQHADGTEM